MALLLHEFIETSFFVLREPEPDVSNGRAISARRSPHAKRLPESLVSSNETRDSLSKHHEVKKAPAFNGDPLFGILYPSRVICDLDIDGVGPFFLK